MRKVYLGHVDVGPTAKLDLIRSDKSEITDFDLLRYLFGYGLLADQVLMQGSAPLKSTKVLLTFLRLSDAFRRNENHEPIPVLAFTKTEEAESFSEYLIERLRILRKMTGDNAELAAYEQNKAIESATIIDAHLATANVPRRILSVSKMYRKALLGALRLISIEPKLITSEAASAGIAKINGTEVLQTFEFIKSLNLKEANEAHALYQLARSKYRESNAAAVNAINSDNSPVWEPKNIWRFLNSVGLNDMLGKKLDWTAATMFKIRRFESFRSLREEYFLSQTAEDIDKLTHMLEVLRMNGRVRSAIKQSPGALSALLFESLNEAGVGYKSLNKAGELIAKSLLSDAADEHYGQRCYKLYGLIEQLQKDVFAAAISS